jgi:hypothetical protein
VSVYYFDANVQVKYHLPEPGSTWVRRIVDEADAAGNIVNTLFTAEISLVEVAAAISVVHRIGRTGGPVAGSDGRAHQPAGQRLPVCGAVGRLGSSRKIIIPKGAEGQARCVRTTFPNRVNAQIALLLISPFPFGLIVHLLDTFSPPI